MSFPLTAVEKFEVRNRWTNAVQFTAEIECSPRALVPVKLGLAVKWARRSGADLRGAVLSGAVLSGADLRDAVLSGADLRDAVLSGADLGGAVLSGAVLRGAELSGAVLRDADLSGAVLRGAVLSGAVLRGAVLSGAVLRGADLSCADLGGAVLSGADLSCADLSGADLSGAVLRGADLRGFPIKIENIHQKVYEAASAPAALNMGDWHTCETTHCRAGWVTTIAGDAGRALEWAMGTPAAAALIYQASDPKLERVPNFYATNEAALKDMKRLAALEVEAA